MLSVLLFYMHTLLASFIGSRACFALSVLLFYMHTLLTCFIGSRACFVLSVLLLSVQSLLACFWRSFSGLGHSHAFRGLVRQTIFCFFLTLEHMLATFTFSGTLDWHCGQTLLGGMIARGNRNSRHTRRRPDGHVVVIRFPRVKNGRRNVRVATMLRSLQRSIFRENRSIN